MGFEGIIFDVDGVLVDSPHERAWRATLDALMNGEWREIRPKTTYSPERFDTTAYMESLAGRPRDAGARAALERFGVPDAERLAPEYAQKKQEMVVQLIEASAFDAFPDALRFVLAVKGMGMRIAAASSSTNANLFLERIRMDDFARSQGIAPPFVQPGTRLIDLFDVNISGRAFPQGKPHPQIFLTAAEELGLSPRACVVVEDASAGVQAAKAGGMAAIGVARLGDEALLRAARADVVVTSLDAIEVEALRQGRLALRRKKAA